MGCTFTGHDPALFRQSRGKVGRKRPAPPKQAKKRNYTSWVGPAGMVNGLTCIRAPTRRSRQEEGTAYVNAFRSGGVVAHMLTLGKAGRDILLCRDGSQQTEAKKNLRMGARSSG